MVEEYARMAELARRMRVYFTTSMSAVSFFTFGMIVGAYFMLLAPFPEVLENWPVALGGLLVIIVVAVAILEKFTPRTHIRHHTPSEGAKWAFSFTAPFSLYAIPYLFPQHAVLCVTMWYPSLGLALLLAHLLIERRWASRDGMRAAPFLLASIIILATSPLVTYLTYSKGVAAAIFAEGLMLLAYYVAGAYALYKAHRALLGEA